MQLTWLYELAITTYEYKDFHHKLVFPGSQILWKNLRANNITIYNNKGSLVAQMVKNLPSMQETLAQSLGREDLLEKGMATHSSMENSMDRGAWQATVHGATESDMTDQLTYNIHMYKILLCYASFRGLRTLVC